MSEVISDGASLPESYGDGADRARRRQVTSSHRTADQQEDLKRLTDPGPHRLNITTFAAVQNFWENWSRIPDEFWVEDRGETLPRHADHDGVTSIAVVSCPCGGEPQVELAEIKQCDGEDCERYFTFTGKGVWVTNSPVPATAQS